MVTYGALEEHRRPDGTGCARVERTGRRLDDLTVDEPMNPSSVVDRKKEVAGAGFKVAAVYEFMVKIYWWLSISNGILNQTVRKACRHYSTTDGRNKRVEGSLSRRSDRDVSPPRRQCACVLAFVAPPHHMISSSPSSYII